MFLGNILGRDFKNVGCLFLRRLVFLVILIWMFWCIQNHKAIFSSAFLLFGLICEHNLSFHLVSFIFHISNIFDKFLLLPIISLKGVRKLCWVSRKTLIKKILTLTIVSLVVVKQYWSDSRDHISVIRCVAFVHCCS